MAHDDLIRSYPILYQHWPGFPPETDEPPPSTRDLRFRRDVESLHNLPSRVLLEFLEEIGARRNVRTFLETRIADYVAIKPETYRAVGANRVPPAPIHSVSP